MGGGTAESVIEFNIAKKENELLKMDEASEHVNGYASFITENPYREEIDAFFRQISDSSLSPAWSFQKDKKVLSWIDIICAITTDSLH